MQGPYPHRGCACGRQIYVNGTLWCASCSTAEMRGAYHERERIIAALREQSEARGDGAAAATLAAFADLLERDPADKAT